MAADAISGEPTLDQLLAKARLLDIEVTPERAKAVLRGARHLHDAVEQLHRFAVEQEPEQDR